MNYFFFWLALILAAMDWVAVGRGWKNLEYFAKPATMAALLAFAIQNGGLSGGMIWFTLGLALSLVGDVILMLPKDRFIAGWISFLLVHLAYTIGFNPRVSPELPVLLVTAGLAMVIALTASQLFRRIAARLSAQGKASLRGPVLAYTIVISLMLFSAMLTLLSSQWSPQSAITVCLGATLFFLSDTVRAWKKYVRALHNGRLLSTVTYHLGQLLIVLGAALHFIKFR